ncbi:MULTISPECIES: hypothetical protein [Klebsiella]|uniref:hypothetical protein n=1 Tax=Klebsiella TaxID=570 RepID=UPI000A26DCF5|nr:MULTISPECIES: hypothetical protein [Klebsiella]EIV5640729.1 hypothetical protein [Klebsiella pneumoniae]EIX9340654.1 hypothetical protein [Klebsiella pneumoniae]EKU9049630.1 hypothetical protein [Klebsiella pneumoniae]ELA1549158.1 hypothetical protein [Klebsiella pneumoniae]ELA2618416.1 hypothetical protein [Klebsiella pneumoniae]
MKFFLVWECFDEKFKLIEKGYHFLAVDDPEDVDIEVSDFVNNMSEARNMNPLNFVVTTCQPMP